ncbi:sodium-dependent transporter [Metasolibacillus sp.]|uniref:sodium-dependent transporter n=1 Tax=Metasolibacillus sp. TaxID=2703680 RepID=UPI0025CD87F8|nr:sodium-dependent transporter [Metasolibacillus sp.]MCT6925134.1 sodium-dependent transporter [Metasolibacillus sp.]MCT6941395.1 sodium-dependent transporter [Metasolibacillus sp.]
MGQQQEQWTSRLGFILATAGSAIGLGAIWKFPYIAGISGGGAFFLIFLIFTLFMGLPILLAEFVIGRGSQKDAVSAYLTFAPNSKWHFVGILGMVTCFILLSFYSVVGGWIILYMVQAVIGNLSGLSESAYAPLFNDFIANPIYATLFQFIFMAITIYVVAKGVQQGIERAGKMMMPALFISFLILIIRSLTLDGVGEGLHFFLYPDFSNMSSKTILFALGQSFFAISVGVSVMVTYSSYLSKNEDLPKSALMIVMMNLFISLLAGLAIFPAVFSFGFEPTEGPGLLFVVLPAVFNQMPFGVFFLFIFLILFLFATLTSAFSMLEIIVAAVTKQDRTKRKRTTWITGILIFIVGIPSALSYGVLSDFTIFDKTIFDAADYLVSNILMPLGALLIALFAGFKIPRKVLLEEISDGASYAKKIFAIWLIAIKYIAPIAIIIVFLDAIGLLKF